jgi:high-affinity iron transporter
LLSEVSLLGKVLHGLIGYTARPVIAQVVAYVATAGLLAGALA